MGRSNIAVPSIYKEVHVHINQYTIPFFQALAKSDLPLRIIELQHFPYCKAFEDLLKAKGHGLHELLFRAINSLNSKHILYIGKHCKALQRLHIKELGPEEDQTMVLMTASKLFSFFFGYREGGCVLYWNHHNS